MAVTTQAQEIKRLRSYLNPYLKGKTVNAVLSALATSSSYLINSAQAVNDSLYVVTAQAQYLDLKLADYGITRDPTIGLSDQVFRTIGIQVKNRKQVRDLINNLLDAIFGDEFVKATNNSQNYEPYALQDGDTLIINYDGSHTNTITFSTDQFTSIGSALAQEIANVISVTLSNLGVSGAAVVQNDGNGNYVQLISNTIGASSSVTVMGGRAQNVLLFPSEVSAGGNFSTQWTLSFQNGGNLRFTWSGGADPKLGVVQPSQYVNIYGGGFSSSANEGTFPITFSQGGAVNIAYFEVNNPTGSTGIVVQGVDNAILFYTPSRQTILDKAYYAAVYQTESNILQIFLPATTQVIKRSRIGAAHLHGITETPVSSLTLPDASNFPSSGPGAYYLIGNLGSTYRYYVWFNVSGGSNTDPMPPGFTGIEVTVNGSDLAPVVASDTQTAINSAVPAITTSIVSGNILTLTIQNASTVPDAGESTSSSLGPYLFDTSQGFTVGTASTTLTAEVNGGTSHVIFVNDSTGFSNSNGYLVLGYGTSLQEGPIPYIATPSSGSILISPVYFIQNDHPIGSSVIFVPTISPIVIPDNGSFYEPFLTDTASGRVYAQNLINAITAAGVTVIYTILYPDDIGLGKWGTQYSEVDYVYGP